MTHDCDAVLPRDDTDLAPQTRQLHQAFGMFLVLMANLLFVHVVTPPHFFEGLSRYLPLHLFLETFALVIAMLVFSIGWNTFRYGQQTKNLILLSCAFLAVALLSFAHMLSYPGMPDFVTPASTDKSLYFGLAAHFLGAVALLLTVVLPHKLFATPHSHSISLAVSLLLTGLVYWLVLFHADKLPALSTSGEGLTPVKIGGEYVIILIHLITALLLLRHSHRPQPFNVSELFAAILLLSLSELCFMLYTTMTDALNLLGHAYKGLAYVFIYKAVFINNVQRPYEHLQESLQQLQREQEALQASQERVRMIAENAHDMIYRYRLLPINNQGFDYINPAITAITGYTPEEHYADPTLLFKMVHPDDRSLLESAIQSAQLPTAPIDTLTMRWIRKDGQTIWTEICRWYVYDDANQVIAIEGISRDITGRKEAEEYMALYDSLTNLPNLMLFHDRLQRMMLQSQHSGQLMAVMFVDLDQFKSINDTLGHVVGDRLLQIVAERMRICVRERDTIARLGGDEFTIVLTDISNAKDAAQTAQQILNTLSQPFYLQEQEIYISASIGITLYPSDARDADILIKYADVAMNRAKHQGRNTYTFYTADMHVRTLEWLTLKNDMRRSIAQNDFVLHYQPQVSLHSGQIVGMEALVRWQHPTLGLLGPNRFIPIAEESGLIVLLGEWLISAACIQNRLWQQQGLPHMRVGVNLSALELAQPRIVNEISQTLQESGLCACYLELELTESMLMHDIDAVIARLHSLKALGIQLSIDDFGTGYSSLNYLKRLPIDTLKIDRSFVCDIPTDLDGATIATTIIAMAHSLGMKVIAEGVESTGQEAFLRQQGCDEIQGYLYSPPLPASKVPAFVQQWEEQHAARWENCHCPHAGNSHFLWENTDC